MNLIKNYFFVFVIIFSVFLIYNEQLADGQYFTCSKPDEKTVNFQNIKFVVNFEGNECEFPLILTIYEENKITTIDLNEKVSSGVSLEMEIIQDNLYLVWNDLKPKEYNKSYWVDPAGNIPIPSHFLTNITLKKISLDGKSIGENRELVVPNYFKHRPIDIVELNDKIWLFWQATDSRTDKLNLIKTQIVDEFFIDHHVLVKDRLISEITKTLNLKEDNLHFIFFRMDNKCNESSPNEYCLDSNHMFILGTGDQVKPGSVYEMVPSPAQLMKIGVPPKDIVCKTGLQLYYRDGHIPLCVKPYTGLYLFERGWSITNEIGVKPYEKSVWYFLPGCPYEVQVGNTLLCFSSKECGKGYLSSKSKGGNYMEKSEGWMVTKGLVDIDYSNCGNQNAMP